MQNIRKIEDTRDYAEAIVEAIRDPFVILDSSLRVVSANQSFYNIFQVRQKQTKGKPFFDLGNGPWDNPKLRSLLTKLLAKESWAHDFELKHTFPILGPRTVLLDARRVVQKKDDEPMIMLTIEDITERKKLEQQKDDFIGIASHELRGPVTNIQWYGQVLRKHYLQTKDKKATKLLTVMEEQLNRLNELVASFVNVYKLQTGKLKLHKKKFSLDSLIAETLRNFQHTTKTHRLVHKGKVRANIVADRERIGQVLVNLISNAIKYSPKADKVVVRLEKKRHRVSVSVQDFGMGIAKDEQKKIYERFFRVKGKKQGKIPGLGLGLFISTEIIKQHKGELWVKSEEGKGSTFFFTLPLK